MAVAAVVLVLVAAVGAAAGAQGATGAIQFQATFSAAWQFGPFCPPGTAAGVDCVRFVGTSSVAGLGKATATYVKTFDRCPIEAPVNQFRSALLDIAGKGSIELTQPQEVCGPPAPAEVGPLQLTVTGGTGIYAGASGSFQFRSSVHEAGSRRCNGFACGLATDTWSGMLSVPNVEFDLTAPVVRGAVTKTVRAGRRARRVRVRYVVTARDAVDGVVPVACKPRSGTLFGAGRTTVMCSATDSSANTRRTRFTVVVRRR